MILDFIGRDFRNIRFELGRNIFIVRFICFTNYDIYSANHCVTTLYKHIRGNPPTSSGDLNIKFDNPQ